MWSDFENETLIYNHKISKIYKKRYQRASEFHSSLYTFLGIINVISSIISSTFTWTSGLDNESEKYILRILITTATTSAIIQNHYNFQENFNNYMLTSKNYSKIQNKIETMGNIHPEYRTSKPHDFLKKIQYKLNELADNRKEISSFMVKWFYQKNLDNSSYLETKHKKYKELKENEKLNYTKNVGVEINTDEESDEDNIP
jgi:hypothetical protein